MKNLSLSILFLFFGILNFNAQTTDFEYISSSDSPYERSTNSEVLRNTSETYARLTWLPELCTQGCQIEFLDVKTDQLKHINVDGTSFDVRGLETPSQYSWRVLKTEGPNTLASKWATFSTDYMSPIQTRQEMSEVLRTWKDHTSEYSNLESYIRDQKGLDNEIMETFIMNFYKGTPPSLDVSGSRNGDCNCDFTVVDNVEFAAPETYPYNDSGDPFCGHWNRWSTYNTRYGAAKNMQAHLQARLKPNQKEAYNVGEFMSSTRLAVHYLCDQDDCCDADYKVAGRIDQNLYGEGAYNKNGGYRIDASDLSFIVESKNGDTELLLAPSAKALTVYENTSVNPEFWSGIFDLVVAGLENYEDILELDADAAEALLDEVEGLIGVLPVTQVTGDDNVNVISSISSSPIVNKTISANETVIYGVFSNSLLTYEEAWGKKFQCGKGYIDIDAHIKTGYSIAISSISNEGGECCRNDYAKWVTGSYLSAANAQTMLAEAGLVVGCNGGEWEDNNGNTIACPNSNPILTNAIGIATKDNECCDGSDINTNLEIDWTCLEGVGTTGGPFDECVSCSLAQFNITIPGCQDGNQHAITITGTTDGITSVLYQNTNFTGCNLQITLPLQYCTTYKVLHSVVGECTNETGSFTVFKTCCKIKQEGPIDMFQSGDDENSSSRSNGSNSEVNLKIFPNPSMDYVTFSSNSDSPSTLQILGIDGKVILTKNLLDNKELRLSSTDFGNGIFIARLITDKKVTATEKFTILN